MPITYTPGGNVGVKVAAGVRVRNGVSVERMVVSEGAMVEVEVAGTPLMVGVVNTTLPRLE